MNKIASILFGLQSDRAKHREQTIKTLPSGALDDSQVIERLQVIASSDPVEYVRAAARERLLAAGQTPHASITPVKLKNGISIMRAIALGAIVWILVAVLLAVLCALLFPGMN